MLTSVDVRESLPGNPEFSTLAVLPAERASCNRVARSNKSGKLVKLPRFCPSVTAAIFNGGGRGLARPRSVLRELEEKSDETVEPGGDGDGVG